MATRRTKRKPAAKKPAEAPKGNGEMSEELRRILERATPRKVAPDRIRPNPRNYKPMTEDELKKEIASIKKYGFVSACVVRSGRPGEPWDHFELIDGEHRWKALQALGAPHVPVNDIGEASDAEADELMIILNELHGKPKYDALGSLIATIAKETSIEEMLTTMPFPEDELRALAAIPIDPLDGYANDGEGKKKGGRDVNANASWETLKLRVPPEAKTIIEAAIATALGGEELRAPKDVKMGLGLERVCKAYLTETGDDEEPEGEAEATDG